MSSQEQRHAHYCQAPRGILAPPPPLHACRRPLPIKDHTKCPSLCNQDGAAGLQGPPGNTAPVTWPQTSSPSRSASLFHFCKLGVGCKQDGGRAAVPCSFVLRSSWLSPFSPHPAPIQEESTPSPPLPSEGQISLLRTHTLLSRYPSPSFWQPLE